MTETTLRVPATDQVDNRARAYDALLGLADLTHSFDPSVRVTIEVRPNGMSTIQPVGSVTLAQASQLAARLGLQEHSESPVSSGVHHIWRGHRTLNVAVVFIDDEHCSCGKPVRS